MTRTNTIAYCNDYLVVPALESHPGITHGFFSRQGGVSPEPWDSCNVGYAVGDSPANVKINRERIKEKLQLETLVSGKQVHGDGVFVVTEQPDADLEVEGFDAFITNVRGIGLMVQQADCQAVLLFDPVRLAVGIAHCGWRGSVASLIGKTIRAMADSFDTKAGNLLAAISPSLGPCCAEFVNYKTELPKAFHGFQVRPDYFDFWAISRMQLADAGLATENIYQADICTVCARDFFSYRRARTTGRCASVIGLI